MKIQKILPYLAFLVIAVAIVNIWMREGFLLARAEEGIPFYNLGRTVNKLSNIWLETGFGIADPFYVPRLPLYYVGSWLNSVGLTGQAFQTGILIVLIFTSLSSFYKLVRVLLPSETKVIYFFAALFYFFNLFTLSQVINRFIYPLMFLWSYLPLFLYIWIRWIETRKLVYIFLLIVTSFVFSDSFGLVSSVFTLWIPAGLFSLLSLSKSNWKVILIQSLIGLFVWTISNIWWIYPTLALQNNTYGSFLDESQSLESLRRVSNYFPNKSIFVLEQEYWFGNEAPWPGLYNSSNFNSVISLSVFFITLFGILATKKSKYWLYLFVLLVVSWFIIKGVNPILGEEFYRVLYTLSPLQVLRNPYEKFGAVWLLTYSTFLALGLGCILKFLKQRSLGQYFTVVLIFLSVLVYLPWPLWNGSVFTKTDYVKVPTYYEESNKYINENGADGRILHLPLISGSTVTYDWNYIGEEPSEFLYDRVSVSKSSHIHKEQEFFNLFRKSIMHKNFANIMKITNINTILLHDDLVLEGDSEGVEGVREQILKWNGVSFDRRIGGLEIYKTGRSLGHVYVISNLTEVDYIADAFKIFLDDRFNADKSAVFVKSRNINNLEQLIADNKPDLKYEKLSSVHYRVYIRNSVEPYFLVLTNNFNDNWKAKVGNEFFNNHFEINGFANGWIIDKKGDYTIDIVFKVWPWE